MATEDTPAEARPGTHKRTFARTKSAPGMEVIDEDHLEEISSPTQIERCHSIGETDFLKVRQEPIAKAMARRHSLSQAGMSAGVDREVPIAKSMMARRPSLQYSLSGKPATAQCRSAAERKLKSAPLTTTPSVSGSSSPRLSSSTASSRATRQLVAFCEEERARFEVTKLAAKTAQDKFKKRPFEIKADGGDTQDPQSLSSQLLPFAFCSFPQSVNGFLILSVLCATLSTVGFLYLLLGE